VRYATEEEKNPTLKEQAQEMLRAREAGDPEVKALWKKMNTRAIDGMRETYKRYGTHIDDATLESDVYTDGKDVAEKGLAQGVFFRDPKGNIALPLPINEDETSYFVVLRSDGTTLYATQDLALVDHRFKTYNMNKMVYIVGNEQDDYFRALFKCFKGLNYPFADQCHHLSYGMIELPNGKMKSRTGNVIDADNLIDELHQTSFEEIKKRYPDLDDSEAHTRAEKIAFGAINFFMLKIDTAKGFVFDPVESLSFEGETGPYIQYTYARSGAILTKANEENYNLPTTAPTNYTQEEHKPLLFHIAQFNDIITKTSDEYKPSLLCRYTLDLCQMINSFYQQGKILNPDDKETSAYRLYLLSSARQTLGKAMDLICVPRVEVM
jgi:arginyl-tRNA synthetase